MIIKKSPSIVYWLGKNLYLNITNKCPNNCYFCIRKFKSGIEGFNLKLEKDPLTNEVINELQNVINLRNWSEIVFCGFGEPLERLDCVIEVTKWIKRYHAKIVTIRIDTNGQGCLLNKDRDVIGELKKAGVDRISISLNAYNSEIYDQICKPTFSNAFESVLEFIERAKEHFDIEITSVTIPEVDILKMEELSRKMGARFRKRKYIPCFW